MDWFDVATKVIGNLVIGISVSFSFIFGRFFLIKHQKRWKALVLISLSTFGYSLVLSDIEFDRMLIITFLTFLIPGVFGALNVFKGW